jgi:hypothetical protein
VSTAPIRVPQDVQNVASAGSDVPHEGHICWSDEPQLAQKRAPAAFS